MAALINQLNNYKLDKAIEKLQSAHDYLVSQAKQSLSNISENTDQWGISIKRISVPLDCKDRPELIGKDTEKLVEVINIAATVERLIDAIKWFSNKYPECWIVECHPSTSDTVNGNDLILADRENPIKVRCEVCDVVSDKRTSNGKEKKDLAKLGCKDKVPSDGIDRYICTSTEFAKALIKPTSKPHKKHYKYEAYPSNKNTQLLLIVSN